MKALLLSLLVSFAAFGQIFPEAIATTDDIPLVKNRARGQLRTTISASATTIVLYAGHGARFTAPTVITIETEDIKCLDLTVDTFTNCERGYDGSTAAVHFNGRVVQGNVVSEWFNALARELMSIEDFLGVQGENFGGGALLTVSAVIDLAAVPDGTCVLDSTAVTLTGAALGGRPIIGVSVALPVGVNLFPKVTGPNTVKVEVCNFSGAAYNPASATYKFGVQP